MKEIHFRGICKDSKRWVYGYYVHFEDFSQGINYHGICSGYYNTHFEVIPETVGQYALDDKNGKGIFEGDIILLSEHDGTKTVQKAVPVCFGEYIDSDSACEDYSCIGFYLKIRSEYCNIGILLSDKYEGEVIGNIYDNPELLEE